MKTTSQITDMITEVREALRSAKDGDTYLMSDESAIQKWGRHLALALLKAGCRFRPGGGVIVNQRRIKALEALEKSVVEYLEMDENANMVEMQALYEGLGQRIAECQASLLPPMLVAPEPSPQADGHTDTIPTAVFTPKTVH